MSASSEDELEIAPGVTVRVIYARDAVRADKAIIITGQAPGAIPNGSRVVKVRDVAGDSHLRGAQATVLSSLGPLPPEAGEMAGEYGYFVGWDDNPQLPVFISGSKIAAL